MSLSVFKWIVWDRQALVRVHITNHKPSLIESALGMVTCFFAGHQWDHCACQRCGKPRDEDHVWELVLGETCKGKCRLCGLPRSLDDWPARDAGQAHGENAGVHHQRLPQARDFYRVYDSSKPYWECYSHDPDDPYDTAITAHFSIKNSQYCH